ncbi:FHF complex subunit HOOK interacting protein 2A-like isoform X2 [Lycorma delicatula]|uniref:FHF complex subunit HOOK interacting protein 2A-like isoform X2 n=1 Tax=Lycorma delicatula TaxID=130591 RepID=UPI003F514CEA
MLGRFSHVLQNAVDAIAPPTPLHDDFVYHWRRLMKHYLDVSSSNKVPVELTNIPAHLQQLQKILQKEDDENKGEKMGPCVEYLLQHNMLDLLATLAATDEPPGMKQHVLQFVTRVITQLRIPVLAHCSVFPSLQRLVKTCDGNQHMPTENDEVHFLFILSALLRKQPQLIHMLDSQASPSTPFDRRSSISSEASSHLSIGSVFQSPFTQNGFDNQQLLSECSTPPPNNPLFRPYVLSSHSREPKFVPVPNSKESQSTSSVDEGCDVFEDGDIGRMSETDEEKIANSEYIILDALLSYMDSADSRVRVKACQGIMLLVSLPDAKLANCLLENSQLCLTVVSKLCSLYADIPGVTDPNQIDELHVSWGLDVPVSLDIVASSEGCREAFAFFTWFDFCDQIIKEAEPGIADALASAIRTHFFQEMFPVEDLADVLSLSVIAKCFKMVTASALMKEMSYWAVGESREADLPQVVTYPVRQALIDCAFNENSPISLEALRLFEVLLEKNNEHILHCLVLAYINRRTYFDFTASASQIASWSDEEDERERCRESPGSDSKHNSASVTSRTFTPTHIEKIIQSFLNVVPSQLRSAPASEASGYHQYVSESARQYSKVVAACKSYAWTSDAASDESSSSDSKPEADTHKIFYEGSFLKMLFSRLRNLPIQAYEINLELTAVVSRLSLLPHPLLHEYLLNPMVPRHAEADSLFASLNDVASQLLTQVTLLPDYKNRLTSTRQHLLGDVPDERDEMSNVLESVVVLEELCKELAAIAYVKFHNAL